MPQEISPTELLNSAEDSLGESYSGNTFQPSVYCACSIAASLIAIGRTLVEIRNNMEVNR